MKKKFLIVYAVMMMATMIAGCGNVVVHDLRGEEILEVTPEDETIDNGDRYENGHLVSDENTIVNANNFYFENCLDQDDNSVTPSTLFANREVTMVNVWATFCGPCINEMPELDELAKEFDRENIGLIGICCDVMDYEGGIDADQLKLAKDIIAETGVHYPNVMLNDQEVLDSVVRIDAVPTTFFVDTDGTVIGPVQVGVVDMDTYKSLALEALKIVRGE